MAKEFSVPPVVFPAGGNPSSSAGGLQHRRVPTAPFQPHRHSNSGNIPFINFDIGSAISGTINAGSSSLSGGSTNFDDEEPLLDELGIHSDLIWRKTRSILNPFRIDPNLHAEADLSGPVLYYMLFGFFQLLARKIQFGVILGWIVVFSLFLYVVFNMLAGKAGNLDLHRCTSIIGYSMLPLVLLSAFSLFIPRNGAVGVVVALIFVLWATRTCARLVGVLSGESDEHCGLIAYACFLIYTILSMIIIF